MSMTAINDSLTAVFATAADLSGASAATDSPFMPEGFAAADSLHAADFAADSLDSAGMAADTLLQPVADTFEVGADAMFGALSHHAGTAADTVVGEAAGAAAGLVGSPVFQIAAIALLLSYMVSLYRHPEVWRYLRINLLSSGAGRSERLYDGMYDSQRSFSWSSLLLGLLFAGVASVRAVAHAAASGAEAAVIPSAVVLWAVPAAAAMLCASAAYQWFMLRLAGEVTVSQPFASALLNTRKLYFRLAELLLTPAVVLYALCPPGSGKFFAWLIALQVAIVAIMFFRETILLFMSKKLSIFHWFLYLCTVEIFPLSLLCLLALRS